MVVETRPQMIKNWTITFLIVALLIIAAKGTMYSFLNSYLSVLGNWILNYLSIFLILAIGTPITKYIITNVINN